MSTLSRGLEGVAGAISPVVNLPGKAVDLLDEIARNLRTMTDGVTGMHGEFIGMRKDILGLDQHVIELRQEVAGMKDHVNHIGGRCDDLVDRIEEVSGTLEAIDAIATRFGRLGGRKKQPPPSADAA